MATREEVGITGVAQVAVTARELGRAIEFYREVLGLRFLFEIPNAAFFECGDIRLMLALPESPEVDHPASILYYRVPDIHAAHASLARRGVRFDREPHLIARMPDHELWMAFFRDSESNLAGLMAEVR